MTVNMRQFNNLHSKRDAGIYHSPGMNLKIERNLRRQLIGTNAIIDLVSKGITLEEIASKNYRSFCNNGITITQDIHKQAITILSGSYPTKDFTNTKIYHKLYYQKIRLNVLKHYGGEHPCCELLEIYPDTCGMDCIELLTIDHEGGGGIEHHKEINRRNIYHWLKKNGYPEGYVDKDGEFHKFRLLCHNCNHLERLRMQKEKDMKILITYSIYKNILDDFLSKRGHSILIPKGSKIGVQSGSPIYKNIFDDFICGIKQNSSKRELRKILKKYYPDNKPTTLETKIGIYKEFIIQRNNPTFKKI